MRRSKAPSQILKKDKISQEIFMKNSQAVQNGTIDSLERTAVLSFLQVSSTSTSNRSLSAQFKPHAIYK